MVQVSGTKGETENQENNATSVDEDEAALAFFIFDSYEELGSAGAVTRILGDKGIRYPSYQTRSGKQRGGNLFQKQKMTRILSNLVYISRIRWSEEEYDGIHQPIITSQQFERVQNQLGQTRNRRRNLRKPKERCYLLSDLLRCSCGAHMSGYSISSRRDTHYRCSIQNHEGGQYSCSSPRVPAEALEEAVILRIRELGNALEAREETVERAVACLDSEAAKLDKESGIMLRRTKADIGQLLEVLKSQGATALKSIQD